ncbi:MAG: hypothetical protein ACFE7E_04165 [Candidatus Hodarchaeota archaeon]
MDLELDIEICELAQLIRKLGFDTIEIKEKRLEARKKWGWGRIHILAKQAKNRRTYMDVHWDALIHFFFLGVDYSRRPDRICNLIIKKAKENGMKVKIVGGTSWFNRRNKAKLSGMNL